MFNLCDSTAGNLEQAIMFLELKRRHLTKKKAIEFSRKFFTPNSQGTDTELLSLNTLREGQLIDGF